MTKGRKFKSYTMRVPISEMDPIEELAKEFNKSKASIIRDALKLYAILKFAEKHGKEILLRDPKTGEIEKLILP